MGAQVDRALRRAMFLAKSPIHSSSGGALDPPISSPRPAARPSPGTRRTLNQGPRARRRRRSRISVCRASVPDAGRLWIRRLTETAYNFPSFAANALVPKLCLGMPMSRQLCCPARETEFRKTSAFQNRVWERGLSQRRCSSLPDLHPRIIGAVHLVAGFDAERFVKGNQVGNGTSDTEKTRGVDVGLDADGEVLGTNLVHPA
jgi:hypothetical protein